MGAGLEAAALVAILVVAACMVAGTCLALAIAPRRRTLEAKVELRCSENRFAALASISPIGIFQLDGDGFLISANDAHARLTGRAEGTLLRHRAVAIVHPEEQARMTEHLLSAQQGGARSFRTQILRADGAVRWIQFHLEAVDGPDDIRFVGTSEDVSSTIEWQKELLRLAFHDPLTGLPNRNLLLDRLAHELAPDPDHELDVAVLYIDIDNFTTINDSLGHAAGDRLLRLVGDRLAQAAREGDTVARMSGDEFVALCPEVAGSVEAEGIAARLAATMKSPFRLGDEDVFASVSIGLATVRPGEVTPEVLMRDADTALYKAKRQGRNRTEIYDSNLRTVARERLTLEGTLRRALDHDLLSIVYQPQVALATGAIVGVEALLRLHDPERGPVSPVEFIPVAEETGLIKEIGEWVVGTACDQLAAWRRSGLVSDGFAMSVNVSARQLKDAALVETISAALERSGLPPRSLCLEITESAVMEDGDGSHAAVDSLNRIGVAIAIDDLGTGYSSLAQLARLPVDQVKVDRSFVAGLDENRSDSAIVHAVVGLAHALGVTCVAEGVETPDQVATLRVLGCQLAQGYHFARPLPPVDVEALLARNGGVMSLGGTGAAREPGADRVARTKAVPST